MRVIALIDMDCFYCQVEEKFNPSLQNKPMAVVQYNLWREGGIIAANYLAKEKGVTKGMWMHEAKKLCPEIEFAQVAELRGRADLTKYRQAGKQVVNVLKTYTDLIERASVDEAYLDLTDVVTKELSKGSPNMSLDCLKTTHVVGCETSDYIFNIQNNQDTDGFCENDLRLAVGAVIVENIRAAVYENTGYKCSAGIAHNKILAKLICGLHKPNKQTVMPRNNIADYFSELPLRKIKRLGGKFGKKIAETLNIQYVGELLKFSEKELSKLFDIKTGHWLYNIARGIDNDPVLPKLLSKSISCCKQFPGKNALFKQKDVEHWINELALEVVERLKEDQEENNRRAKMATISFIQVSNQNDVSNSKTCPLKSYDAQKLAQYSLDIIKKSCQKPDGSYHLKYLGIVVGQFENIGNNKDLTYFFGKNNTQIRKKVELDACQPTSQNPGIKDEEVEKSKESLVQPNLRDSDTLQQFVVSNNLQNDIFPVSEEVDSKKIFNSGNENSESQTICSLDTPVELNNKESFFMRYFKNSLDDHEITSNFSSDLSHNDEPASESDVNLLESTEKCEQCEQHFTKRELTLHRDYHYALELYKDDLIALKSSSSTVTVDGPKKRKISDLLEGCSRNFSSDVEGSSVLTQETCPECFKKIESSQLAMHMDYHAARKLNKELNFQNTLKNENFNKKQSKKVENGSILRFIGKKST